MKHRQQCGHPWCRDRSPLHFIVSTGKYGDWLISPAAVDQIERLGGRAVVRFVDKETHHIVATKPGPWVVEHLGKMVEVWRGRSLYIVDGVNGN